MQNELRRYIDRLRTEGYSVRDDHGEDPDLIDIEGRAVDTWRENYPYDTRMDRATYEVEKYLLQIELLKFQSWAKDNGSKHIIVFEGRDAAGKGGTIKRFQEYINVRHARTVALNKPSDREQGQWYLQRYISTSPPPVSSCCSTVPGTTAPGSNGSWVSAATTSTNASWNTSRCSRSSSWTPASR